MIGRRGSAETAVESRGDMQADALALLQSELDALGAGIQATDVLLLYVHAPAEVHFAYLDVANALEDKERNVLRGKGYEVRTLAEARAAANAVRMTSEGEAIVAREIAAGQAAAFRALASAFRGNRNSLLKDVCDAFVRTAANADLVVLLSDAVDLVLSKDDRPAGAPAAPAQPADRPTTPQWDEDR
jgi:regulator of protease activity HflC (stomatin/prohibitin superfamily)